MLELNTLSSSVLGMSASVLTICCFLPYIRDMLMRRTQPRRSSWLIWAVVTMIAFLSQASLPDAGASLWFSGAIAATSSLVFLLSLPFGTGRFLDRADAAALCFAAIALFLWALTSHPGYSLFCAIAISSVAGALTAHQAFRAPNTETLSKWVIGCFACALAVVSVGSANLLLLAQPVYLLTLHVVVSCAILCGRARAAALP